MAFIQKPVPQTGHVKIIRENIAAVGKDVQIVQHGGSSFRLHAQDMAVTVSPDDALWIIEQLQLGCKKSPIGLRRVVIWSTE